MKFSDIKRSVIAQFNVEGGNEVVPFIMGKPGGGKSACAREIFRDMGFTEDNTVEFNGSLREPVDILGTPKQLEDFTRWVAPEELYKLRRGVGRCALLLEEVSDSTVPMQNALCRVILDRMAGQMPLSDELFILATGNRTEDKSGASRLTSKLANRARRINFDENLDDWCNWAIDNGLPIMLVQFIRFRPNLLSDFDPNRFENPTPRAWARVAKIPTTLPDSLFFEHVKGDVGEGAAAEFTGFLRIAEKMPDPDDILKNPKKIAVPTDPAVLFALTGALAHRATKDNFEKIYEYISRMSPDFQVMCVNDAQRMKPEIRNTNAFVQWAIKNANVLV